MYDFVHLRGTFVRGERCAVSPPCFIKTPRKNIPDRPNFPSFSLEAPMRAHQPRPIVLVVEDDALVRSDIVSEFDWQGWKVLDAPNGEQALTIAKDNRLDIVVTDIQLGGPVNGWDVGEAVRDLWPDAVVVYMSGNASDRSRLVQKGVFFDKPVDTAHVVDTCHRLCTPAA
jgi:CheY-like chemotaxis protein